MKSIVKDKPSSSTLQPVPSLRVSYKAIPKPREDFYYIMTKKTIKHASADVGLIFCAYNLCRIFNLIDHNLLKQYLKVLALYFGTLRAIFIAFYTLFYFEKAKEAF
ncbi:hypothetical protein IQ02_01857 [Flavobacterium glaciei]|uniref:Uncharacterized protein n=2 Tax=Flavobacterium glaciei TaxID=386300 RepID=A0A562PS88_9FLAO|nr:hypothetical protein DFR66_108147 [Flavobacterium glaciei]TWI47020.1 hypothetical protein IQ02_01857 [Flavobacterium glaciei]